MKDELQNKSLTLFVRNERMRKLLSGLDKIVGSDSSVLLIGEKEVGKEIFTEFTHHTYSPTNRPFLKTGNPFDSLINVYHKFDFKDSMSLEQIAKYLGHSLTNTA